MTALFNEVEKYESDMKLTQSLRRLCYIMTMLLSDGVYHDFFKDDNIDEIQQKRFSEENFFIEHYDRLIEVFPRSKEMFSAKKFLDE